jgi:hypothetical protein
MNDSVFRVPPGTRVRFARQDVGSTSVSDPWRVVRVNSSGGKKRRAAGDSKVLVSLRMDLRYRQALALLAHATDRSLSWTASVLVRHAPEELPGRDLLPPEADSSRGRPNPDTEVTINRAIEIDGELSHSFTTQTVGPWVDQALYFESSEIERLELLAKKWNLTSDQTLDALVAHHLAASLDGKD